MGITFDTDEVFEMAEEIERNGARLYRQAAENAADEDIKKLFADMAAMEDNHLETFRRMRRESADEEKRHVSFDPDNQAALYVQAMARGRGSEGMKSTVAKFTGKEPAREILEAALEAEKESVLFYFGLRSMARHQADKDRIEAIIEEELGHVTVIHDRLEAMA
jgi:rubrerythrin